MYNFSFRTIPSKEFASFAPQNIWQESQQTQTETLTLVKEVQTVDSLLSDLITRDTQTDNPFFSTAETQTVNPAILPHCTARMGGSRKRNYVLSPSKPSKSADGSETNLRKSHTSAKVIEVVIKTEPEDAESGRLFYPVDITCGRCSLVSNDLSEGCGIIQSQCSENNEQQGASQTEPSFGVPFTIPHKRLEIKSEDKDVSKSPPYHSSDIALLNNNKTESKKRFTCPRCSEKSFDTATELVDHLRNKAECSRTKTATVCCFCPHKLNAGSNLISHINKSHCISKCEHCGKKVAPEKKGMHIRKHMISHKSKSTCFSCDYKSDNLSILTLHMITKHIRQSIVLDERTFKIPVYCNSCKKEFASQVQYDKHSKKCLQGTVDCKKEPVSLVDGDHLVKETQLVKLGLDFCLYCGTRINYIPNMLKHLHEKHSEKLQTPEVKELCQKILKHVKFKKDRQKKTQIMLKELCGKSSKDTTVQTGNENDQIEWFCRTCNSSFPSEDELINHQLRTEYCFHDQSLEEAESVGLTLRKEKLQQFDTSGDSEVDETSENKNEQKVVTKSTTYTCGKCNKVLGSRKTLIQHLKRKSCQIACIYCGQYYRNVKQVMSHYSKTHKEKLKSSKTKKHLRKLLEKFPESNQDCRKELIKVINGNL